MNAKQARMASKHDSAALMFLHQDISRAFCGCGIERNDDGPRRPYRAGEDAGRPKMP